MPTPQVSVTIRDNVRDGHCVTLPDGLGQVTLKGQNMTFEGLCVRGVEVMGENEVSSHSTHTFLGSVSHNIHFKAGGFLHVAYAASGEVMLLEGFSCRMTLNRASRVLSVGPYRGLLP